MRPWVFKVTFQQYFSYILTFELTFLARIWCKVEIHGYLRTWTFYTPKRKYDYKYTSITKCLTCSPREMLKKIFKYPLSRPTKYSELEGVDSQKLNGID
jgi:hypothetical protein